MKRVVCLAVLSASIVFASCAGPESVGLSADAASASGSKQVIVSPSQATLDPGQTQQFSAQLLQDGKVKKAAFTWSSSAPAVATVSSSGLVTAVAGGEAIITASASSSLSGTAHVTVSTPPPPPPRVVATIQLGAGAFGSTVSANFTGWVGQPGAGAVQRLDLATAQITGTASAVGGFPVQLYPNAAGTRIYIPNFGGVVASIDTGTLAMVNSVHVAGDAYGITAFPTGDTVVVGITDGPIYLIALAQESILKTLPLPVAAGYHFEWNQSRTRLYAAARGFDGGRVYELNTALDVLRTFETGGSPQAIALSADGSKLFIAAEAGDVIVWDIAVNAQVGTITTECNGYGLLRTPDNSRLYVSCALNGRVVVVNPTTGAMIATLNVGGSPRELSFDPASGSLIVPNEAGWVDIIR